jgi:hypothetical protein
VSNVRCYVEQKNMVGYRNPNLTDGNKHYLYWWLMRLLLERVTEFCERMTSPEDRGKEKLRIIFSRRGGMQYSDFASYLSKLRRQSSVGMLYVDTGDLSWSVVDDEEVFALTHKERAGLQLADIVAGSFFQAVERNRPADCDPVCAILLKPRMALSKYNRHLGYSLKTMPDLHKMGLTLEQRALFEAYGYAADGW